MNMLTLLQREQILNFVLALITVFSILVIGFSVAANHQYKIIKSRYNVYQYERKIDILDDLSSELELIILCQKELNNKTNNLKTNEALKLECTKYSADFDINLRRLSEFFDSDSDTYQKITEILNRSNPQNLDTKSLSLTNQIIEQLHAQLNEEKEHEHLPSYF